MGFRLQQKSLTLNDLERRFTTMTSSEQPILMFLTRRLEKLTQAERCSLVVMVAFRQMCFKEMVALMMTMEHCITRRNVFHVSVVLDLRRPAHFHAVFIKGLYTYVS